MGRPDLLRAEGMSKAKNSVICLDHFAEEMWVKSKTRNTKLAKHAVPSIFPGLKICECVFFQLKISVMLLL